MKSLILAPVLASLANTDAAAWSPGEELAAPLRAIASVEDPPLIELEAGSRFTSVATNEDEGMRVQALRQEVEKLGARLIATQHSVETVAQQRDQAREEVRALTKANHDMLKEMKVFREEMKMARRDAAARKTPAGEPGQQAGGQGPLAGDLRDFHAAMMNLMNEFEDMKGEIAAVRRELQDPIERANLKEELARSQTSRKHLEEELEWALVAREKAILEAKRSRMEMEERIAGLNAEIRSAREIRDELRSTNAGKMKALADVELLKKELFRSSEIREKTHRELQEAREGLLALQAEKTAVGEASLIASQERNRSEAEAEALRGQVVEARSEVEASRVALARLTAELEETQVARQQSGQELELATSELDKSKKDVLLLSKAKGGLEELLFRKTAEIRKLKVELRSLHAENEGPDEPPLAGKARAAAEEAGDAPAATALAD